MSDHYVKGEGGLDEFGRKPPKLWRHFYDVFHIVIDDDGAAVSPWFADSSGAEEWRDMEEGPDSPMAQYRVVSVRFDPSWDYGIEISDDPRWQSVPNELTGDDDESDQ